MNFLHVGDELISVEIAIDFCLQTLAGRQANRLRKNLCQALSPDTNSVYTVARRPSGPPQAVQIFTVS
jgi:hypothetical protein